MSQDITIAGASYTNVPAIIVPKTGGGTTSFIDVSSTTYPFWKKYEEVVEGFLKSISLENIINDSKNRNYFDYSI